MESYETLLQSLKNSPRRWLITGVAGFIGSNLLEQLLRLNQQVIGLDNFSTGRHENLEAVKNLVGPQWKQFEMIEGDICDLHLCQQLTQKVDYVLHQAALGSVPRSIEQPLKSHESNVNGHLNILKACTDAPIKKLVYASSSSVYGDNEDLPKKEEQVGNPLSPYAATKKINEIYSQVFHRVYHTPAVGLRYFNVFGARQDPNGPYAAVIPKWITAMLRQETVEIYGDGKTSRDFCYIDNVVQANIRAAVLPGGTGEVFNVAVGATTSLNDLFLILKKLLKKRNPDLSIQEPVYKDFRPGDIRHSFADITRIQEAFSYTPSHSIEEGLEEALDWYLKN
ncbi:MAG: SDR family oxidoreductase [Bdellovibrio sp.]|nr:MAG: SDR family oxidoreductase [Bdellovibrio sp.]